MPSSGATFNLASAPSGIGSVVKLSTSGLEYVPLFGATLTAWLPSAQTALPLSVDPTTGYTLVGWFKFQAFGTGFYNFAGSQLLRISDGGATNYVAIVYDSSVSSCGFTLKYGTNSESISYRLRSNEWSENKLK